MAMGGSLISGKIMKQICMKLYLGLKKRKALAMIKSLAIF